MPFRLYLNILKTEEILQFWDKKFSSFQRKRLKFLSLKGLIDRRSVRKFVLLFLSGSDLWPTVYILSCEKGTSARTLQRERCKSWDGWWKEAKEDVNGRNKGKREIGSKGDRDNSISVHHTQAERRWIGNGESASVLAIVRRCTVAAHLFPRKYAGAGVLHRAWWARKEDNEGRKPFQWLCMRFLIRLRDRLNDPATSYLPFRVTSLSLSLLYVDNFVARSSTRSICPPYVYNGSSRFSPDSFMAVSSWKKREGPFVYCRSTCWQCFSNYSLMYTCKD